MINAGIEVDGDMPEGYRRLRLRYPLGVTITTRHELENLFGISGRRYEKLEDGSRGEPCDLLLNKLAALEAEGWIHVEKNGMRRIIVTAVPEEVPAYLARISPKVKKIPVTKDLFREWSEMTRRRLRREVDFTKKDWANWNRTLRQYPDAELLLQMMKEYWRPDSPFRSWSNFNEFYTKRDEIANVLSVERSMDARDKRRGDGTPPALSRLEKLQRELDTAIDDGNEKLIDYWRGKLEAEGANVEGY